ncbi:MAG: MinD/ParA family protein [Solirubrobacterales bacterium]|nr:MinD/ParA family protein [Solirubrobacterales bacterium]
MEPRPLNGLDQAHEQEALLEQAGQIGTAPERDVRPGPAPDDGDAEMPPRGAAARGAMSRRDVYTEPMRAGRPVPTGPLTRFSTWLKFTLSSELQRREWALDEQLAHVPPMSRPNTVAVISPKGGVGKTTVSFVLGNLLAEQLRLRVIALDANPDFGTLASLAPDEHRSTRSLADLLADSSQIESPAELHPYVARLPTGLHLLSAPAHAEVMAQMTPGLYSRLLDFLERFYEVVILDLGTGITDPLAHFAIDRADQTVVITTPEWVTAAGVLGALRYLQLEQGTLVLNQAPTGRHAGSRDVIEANFRRHAVETSATIPYDDRLRAMLDTGTYSLSSLKLSTRVPVKELGAAIAYNFV